MTAIRGLPRPSALVRRTALVLSVSALALGCPREPEAYRGAGLQVDTLPVMDVVRVYRAALAAAFNLDDPALTLLLDPTLLPRAEGLAGGDTVPPAVAAALHRTRLVKGACVVPIERTRTPLVCRADRPGYVVRLSAPFALSPDHDSVQVHLVVQQYAIPRGRPAE